MWHKLSYLRVCSKLHRQCAGRDRGRRLQGQCRGCAGKDAGVHRQCGPVPHTCRDRPGKSKANCKAVSPTISMHKQVHACRTRPVNLRVLSASWSDSLSPESGPLWPELGHPDAIQSCPCKQMGTQQSLSPLRHARMKACPVSLQSSSHTALKGLVPVSVLHSTFLATGIPAPRHVLETLPMTRYGAKGCVLPARVTDVFHRC